MSTPRKFPPEVVDRGVAALIDAKAAGELLGVPHTWVLEQARHDRIPHVRLGRYVRFDSEQLLAWSRNRARGPVYPAQANVTGGPGDVDAPRGPTPNR
jgi:excisionase family DNA binding protein